MARAHLFCVIILDLLLVCYALRWTSSASIRPGATLSVCAGQNVTLGWTYVVDQGEQTMSVQWYHLGTRDTDAGTGLNDRTLIATETSGVFLAVPSATHRIVYVPNAGIQIFEISVDDIGRYTVNVNLNAGGSIVTAEQSVFVNVSGARDCVDFDSQVGEMSVLIDHLESENSDLKTRLQHLEEFHLLKDYLERPATCLDVKVYDSNSAVHTLYLHNNVTMKVFCDQSTAGGWTVLQRRKDGTVDFYREWWEYERGFGKLEGEFWLGLEKMHRLTSERAYMLRIELQDVANRMVYAEYANFSVGNESNQYTLTVGGYKGTAGDSLASSSPSSTANGMKFSTYDRDNDRWGNNCALYCYGAWWYNTDGNNRCTETNLNGVFSRTEGDGRIIWAKWPGGSPRIKGVEMKIRAI